MKLSLNAKSLLSSSPIHSFSNIKDVHQKSQLSLSDNNKLDTLPNSQSDRCLKSYLNGFPQHKRKHNVSLFNFFTKKTYKKYKDINPQTDNSLQNSKTSFQQKQFITKKLKGPYPSLSAQKLKIYHISSKQKMEICLQKVYKAEQQICKEKENTFHNANKINENLTKNMKFDRKKYMFYRYRKKSSPQKNNAPAKDIIQPTNREKTQTKKPYAYFNIKTDIQSKNIDQQCQYSNTKIQFKRSFYGIIPTKNVSFSEAKCKLTIEPMRKQGQYRLIDRQSISKTTRQMRQNKKVSKNGTKIFSQAIHFKSRKGKFIHQQQQNMNPQRKKQIQRQQKILGWNIAQQQHPQQQYF